MVAVLKILFTLALIVVLLNRKVKMGPAMLAGSLLLFVLSGPELAKLTATVWNTLTSYSTWEIMFALFFVMCLEHQLRVNGIIDGFMSAARSLMKSDRALLALMPAFLGFLPSLGGAIFSAPLVQNAARGYLLTPEKKSAINYWFRHVWEYSNPIFTGMLLASQLSGISLGTLVVKMAWLTVVAFVFGWLILIVPIRKNPDIVYVPEPPSDTNGRFIALAAGPIAVNIILVTIVKLPASVSMLLVVAAMAIILKQKIPQLKAMLLHALDGKLWWGIAGIMFFQHMLNQSGLIADVAQLLEAMAVPATIVIGIIAFTGGLLTGTSQGFVAISFPFIAALAPGDLNLAMIAFALGMGGQLLSPAHLCLLVTIEYFKADFVKTLRPVFLINAIIITIVYFVSM